MDIDTGTGGRDVGCAHPLLAWLADVGAGIDAVVECPSLSLPLGEYESAVRQIAVYEARLASVRLSLTRQAELNEVRKRAIRRLPNDVGAEARAEAEAFLLDSARALDVDDLDKAGRHLYEVIAAEDAEQRIGKQLEQQERRAGENRTLSFGPVRTGRTCAVANDVRPTPSPNSSPWPRQQRTHPPAAAPGRASP